MMVLRIEIKLRYYFIYILFLTFVLYGINHYCTLFSYKVDQSEFIIAVLEVLNQRKREMVVDSIIGEKQQM